MGRALFSQNYSSTPAIREEPDPAAATLDIPCERWSAWNQFDPDSEEFFKDAQLEHFIDGPVDNPIDDNPDEPHVVILDTVVDNNSSSSFSTSSNDNGDEDTLSDTSDSPMSVNTDDPATLLTGAYTPVDWQQRFLEASSDSRRQGRPTRIIHRGPRRTGISRQYTNSGESPSTTRRAPVSVFIPPASYRTGSTSTPALPVATAQEAPSVLPSHQTPGVLRSPVSRRTVSITPINIPSEPSLPSPDSPSTPSTPAVTYPASTNTLTTPSPAPNATPRIYTWNRALSIPANSTRDGPLTNPRARLSLSRIDTMSIHQYSAPVPVLDRHY